MIQEQTAAQKASQSSDDEPINLLYPLIVLAKNKKKIIFLPIAAAILAAGLSFLIPNKYVATAQVLPPTSQAGSAALLAQMGGGLGGIASGALGLKNPNDTYIGILTSRTVQERLIDRFKLQDVYERKLRSDTRKMLAMASKISSGKNGFILIEVEDENPKLAADLANSYVEELQKMSNVIAVTEASQRRLFFEKQLLQVKENLSAAEVDLKKSQEKTGIIQLAGQAEAIIRSLSELKAKISSREVELGAMRSFATSNNPNYVRIEQELIGLRAQLKKNESGLNQGQGDIFISTKDVPEAGLEYVRRLRDVKYYESMFELLAKQFELAKIDEAKQGSVLQVLDSAIVPDRKSSPARGLIAIGAFFLTLFFLILWSFIREVINGGGRGREENDPQINLLKENLRWK